MSDCTQKQGSTERFFLRGVKTRMFKNKKQNLFSQHFTASCADFDMLLFKIRPQQPGTEWCERNWYTFNSSWGQLSQLSTAPHPAPPSEAAQLPWCLNRWLKGKDDNVHIVSVWESEIMRSKRECLMSVCMILFCVSVQREKIIYIFFKKQKLNCYLKQ